MATIVITAAELAELRRARGPGIKRILDELQLAYAIPTVRQGRVAHFDESMLPRRHKGPFMAALARVRRTLAVDSADEIWRALTATFQSTRKNAGRKGRPFTLTLEDLRSRYTQCDGCCEVTGVAFSLNKFGTVRAPFAPSIDRIDCGAGYVASNVRLTCQMVNLAMNIWGEDVLKHFLSMARGTSNITGNFTLGREGVPGKAVQADATD